jgi:hypothetical protein
MNGVKKNGSPDSAGYFIAPKSKQTAKTQSRLLTKPRRLLLLQTCAKMHKFLHRRLTTLPFSGVWPEIAEKSHTA